LESLTWVLHFQRESQKGTSSSQTPLLLLLREAEDFLKGHLAQEAYQIRKSGGLPERTPSLRSLSNKESGGLPERTPSLRSLSNKESGGLSERTPSLRSLSNKERVGPLALIPQNIQKINNPEIQPCVCVFLKIL